MCAFASPLFVSSSSLARKNNFFTRNTKKDVACEKQVNSSPHSELRDVATVSPIIRRSASYPPSLWPYERIQAITSKYTGEKYAARLETLKEEVRNIIYRENEKKENPLSTLNLVDDLQRLGIWYHFVDDISNVLDYVYYNYYKSPAKWNTLDLNLKALGFRLLRHNGYYITQDIFEDIKDEAGNFKGHLIEDTLGMLNLYEASYHSFEDENILDEARDFTAKYLQGSLGKISDQYLSSLTSCALDMPLHWRIARVETKWFIEAYEKRIGMNPTGFALITSVDDVYDVHGTLDELEKFTDVISRWNIYAIEELPDYMKICFLAIYNSWEDLCNAYLVEARRYHTKYMPTFKEYLDIAEVSVAVPILLTYASFVMNVCSTEEVIQSMDIIKNLIHYSSLLLRLADDL
nr:camphene synthase [Tanacetum cinerariifolium]